jgi:tetraacyldisaccharide 4'-kinase
MLREPLAGLARAEVVCLTRADHLEAGEREAIRERVLQLAPRAAWCEAAHVASGLQNKSGETLPAAAIAGRRVAAFCGIGNPAAFRRTLESLGGELVLWREYPDHHAYGERDQHELAAAIGASDAEIVVTTRKDLVKLPAVALGGLPLWALAIEMQFLAGRELLASALERVAPALP